MKQIGVGGVLENQKDQKIEKKNAYGNQSGLLQQKERAMSGVQLIWPYSTGFLLLFVGYRLVGACMPIRMEASRHKQGFL